MKFKAIAKASLALGMLATGVITSNVQSVQAKTEVKQQSEADLKLYYSGPSFEHKKVTGFKYTDEKGSFFEFIDRGQFNKVSLVCPDKDKLNDGDNSGLDVFVVREGYGRQADNHSIGGVTKTNRQSYFDQINTPILEIKNDSEDLYKGYHLIFKEDISLKELDYRLRERAIKQYGLYSNGLKQGQITITMNDGTTHTIDLSQKLEKERMGESIDGRQIQKILVEIK